MGHELCRMGCVSSKAERDLFGHGMKRADDVPEPTPPATAHSPVSRDDRPNPDTSPMIQPRTPPSSEPSKCSWDEETCRLETLTTSPTDSKPRGPVPTMGCRSTNASGPIDCLDSDCGNTKPSKRPHPRSILKTTSKHFGQSTPNTEDSPMMLHRTHSCLTSAPVSSKCALLSRTLSADALECDAWAPCLRREIPEKTISFNLSNYLSNSSASSTTGTTINSDAYFLKMGLSSVIGARILEYLGLVLDHHAMVREVLKGTQAKTSGVQPGWSMRWIEVAGACGGSSFQKSRLTSIPVSCRRNVLDILNECKTNRQFCMKVVFACTPAKDLEDLETEETEDNFFSPDPYRQSVDSDYTSDDNAAGTAPWFRGQPRAKGNVDIIAFMRT